MIWEVIQKIFGGNIGCTTMCIIVCKKKKMYEKSGRIHVNC